ncbi:hypothetical protein COA01_15550 [Bacillus cereus]|uniref:hypothetical protein n=1 Tax=Bacillus cereus TaxID=1396 RepID=UPI000BFC013B|nr:hypothetical protein [Bacillus cereus]PGP20953.1 hypothetical protein COA01_15550 [Bacillus cereus]
MDTLWNPELERKARLEAFRDCIVYNLETEDIVFNETELREKLNQIKDEYRLMILTSMAARTDNIEHFLNRL